LADIVRKWSNLDKSKDGAVITSHQKGRVELLGENVKQSTRRLSENKPFI